MSEIDDIVGSIPMDQLASQLGTDPQSAESAARSAIPALLGGLQANAADPAGAASLTDALSQHSPDLVEGGVNLADVNTMDGQKIVSNIFGDHSDQVVQTLGDAGGQNALMQKLLPILAPIVMAYVAKRLTGGAASGGGLGGMLGGLLGGGQQASGGLTEVLGQMLGGSSPGQSQQSATGGGIIDMLGGLLGGGRR